VVRRLALAASILLPTAAMGESVMPGQVAPAFTLQDLSGASHSLGDHAGKVVLLAFVGWG
jgi:hypothetical protein